MFFFEMSMFKVSYNKDTLNLQKLGYSEPGENTGNNDNVYIKTDLADFRSNSDAKGLVEYTWQNASDNNSVLTFDFKGKNIELEDLSYDGDITASPEIDDVFDSTYNIVYGDINTAIENSDTEISVSNKYKITFNNGKLKLPQYSAGLFANCNNNTSTSRHINEIDLTNVDMNNIVNSSYMFYNRIKLTLLDLSNFTGENVTNAAYMFYFCENLTSLDLSKFTGESLKNANGMFQGCYKLTSLDLRKFTGESLRNAGNTFYDCSSLTTLTMKGSAINKIISRTNPFLSLDTGVTVDNDKTYKCTCTYDNGVKITAATII